MEKLVNNTVLVRQTNTTLVLNSLRKLKSATIAEIANDTGLSVSTCGTLVRKLVRKKEIIEGDLLQSTGGRPSKQYIFNSKHELVLAICMVSNLKTHLLRWATADLCGNVISEDTVEYDDITFEMLDDFISEQIKEHPDISAITVGIPGMVNDNNIRYCDIPSLNGIPLGDMLREKYNLPIIVEKEMKLKTYGYYKNTPEVNHKALAIINAPEDYIIGAGFVLNDQVLEGYRNLSGEVSYLPCAKSHEEQISASKNTHSFMDFIVDVICSIIPIINPEYMVLAGMKFKPGMLDYLYSNCEKKIPSFFMPELIIHQDLTDYYVRGAIQYSLDQIRSTPILVNNGF